MRETTVFSTSFCTRDMLFTEGTTVTFLILWVTLSLIFEPIVAPMIKIRIWTQKSSQGRINIFTAEHFNTCWCCITALLHCFTYLSGSACMLLTSRQNQLGLFVSTISDELGYKMVTRWPRDDMPSAAPLQTKSKFLYHFLATLNFVFLQHHT